MSGCFGWPGPERLGGFAQCVPPTVALWQQADPFGASLLLLCHQTAFIHLSSHFLAFSLNFLKGPKCMDVVMGIVTYVWFQEPDHTRVECWYFHFLRCPATPVRNLFRHIHAAQGCVPWLNFQGVAQLCAPPAMLRERTAGFLFKKLGGRVYFFHSPERLV